MSTLSSVLLVNDMKVDALLEEWVPKDIASLIREFSACTREEVCKRTKRIPNDVLETRNFHGGRHTSISLTDLKDRLFTSIYDIKSVQIIRSSQPETRFDRWVSKVNNAGFVAETCFFAVVHILNIDLRVKRFAWRCGFGIDTILVPLTLLQYQEFIEWIDAHFPYLFHECVLYPWSWYSKRCIKQLKKDQRVKRMIHRKKMLPLLKERFAHVGAPFTFASMPQLA